MSKLLPVIHIEHVDKTVKNALLAKGCGCDGCFLIDHGNDRLYLLEHYKAVREAVGDWWVGINDLSCSGPDVFTDLPAMDGVWVDNLGIDESREEQPEAQKFLDAKTTLLFGGAAFKYQKRVNDLKRAATLASRYCDVVTTSGDGTGKPPTVEKIRTMKEAIGDKPLAIASGITLENVLDFVPYTAYFLVATGISLTFTMLDRTKVSEMVSMLKESSNG